MTPETTLDPTPPSMVEIASCGIVYIYILKLDIMNLFKDFHERGKFVRSLNSSFLVLIPKRGGVEDLKEFRPISLVGSLYKLIAKVLANRLKKVMNKLVNTSLECLYGGETDIVCVPDCK